MKFTGVNIGIESRSGLAVSVHFPELGDQKDNDAWKWVPLSQVSYMKRNPKIVDDDEIEIADWWCMKNGLEDLAE